MVRNMERLLEFYQDVLDVKAWSDRPFTLQSDDLPIGKKGYKLRLVNPKSESDEIGMIGLMEFLNPIMPAPKITN